MFLRSPDDLFVLFNVSIPRLPDWHYSGTQALTVRGRSHFAKNVGEIHVFKRKSKFFRATTRSAGKRQLEGDRTLQRMSGKCMFSREKASSSEQQRVLQGKDKFTCQGSKSAPGSKNASFKENASGFRPT